MRGNPVLQRLGLPGRITGLLGDGPGATYPPGSEALRQPGSQAGRGLKEGPEGAGEANTRG